MSTSWIGRRGAERLRRFIALTLAALAFAMASPARAFQATQNADGSFEYFFAAPSLRIESAGDLDLTGLSFIEGVADGFRVGASFGLDWLGGESGWLAQSAATWSGLATLPRSLAIISGGDLDLGSARLRLAGGTISLTGETIRLGGGAIIDAGGSGAIVITAPDGTIPVRPVPLPGSEGAITILPGGDIGLIGTSPIPEPTTAALLLAGLLALAGVAGRGARMAQ
jgi:hypothetical protein